MINVIRLIPYIVIWVYGTFCVHFALFTDGSIFERLMVMGMFIITNELHTISDSYFDKS